MRYAQEYRNSIEDLKNCRYKPWNSGQYLRRRRRYKNKRWTSMINSENAMLRGSVLFNVRDRDLEYGRGSAG
jgi:Cu(I)/Ag(I) efflux system membrane protein CusA/SilA